MIKIKKERQDDKNNKYNIFDIETTRKEIGYKPQHDAESLYGND